MADVKYTVTDLGTLGGPESSASSINSKGQIVGSAKTADGQTHAFFYSDKAMIDLGTLGGSYSSASGINDAGQIVGTSKTNNDVLHAYLYQGGQMLDLGTLGGSESYAGGINNQGQIVGTSYCQSEPWNRLQHAFLYSNGTMTDLGAPTPQYPNSSGARINNKGQIAGTVDIEMRDWVQPALYSGDKWNVLSVPQWGSGYVDDINDRGQAVVSERIVSPFPTRGAHVLLYSDGILTDLGNLAESYNSFPAAINNVGQIVGYSSLQNESIDSMRAFLYSDGRLVNLDTLINPQAGWELTCATDINDAGQIVGWGWVTVEENGQTLHQTRAFLLTPVPEPTIAWMIPAAFAMFSRRRQSR
jgi:probable HAF family extracellular repeat protein